MVVRLARPVARLVGLLALLVPVAAAAADLRTDATVFLQTQQVMEQKFTEPRLMVDYIHAAEAAARGAFASLSVPATSGFLVFAIREGNRSNAWVDFQPPLSDAIDAQVVAALKRVAPFRVTNGTLVFALKVSIGGAPACTRTTPLPPEWRRAMRGQKQPIEPEALVQLAWP